MPPGKLCKNKLKIRENLLNDVKNGFTKILRKPLKKMNKHSTCICHKQQTNLGDYLERLTKALGIKLKLIKLKKNNEKTSIEFVNNYGNTQINLIKVPAYPSRFENFKETLESFLKSKSQRQVFKKEVLNRMKNKLDQIQTIMQSIENNWFWSCSRKSGELKESAIDRFEKLCKSMSIYSLTVTKLAIKNINGEFGSKHRIFCAKFRKVDLQFHGFHRFQLSVEGFAKYKEAIRNSFEKEKTEESFWNFRKNVWNKFFGANLKIKKKEMNVRNIQENNLFKLKNNKYQIKSCVGKDTHSLHSTTMTTPKLKTQCSSQKTKERKFMQNEHSIKCMFNSHNCTEKNKFTFELSQIYMSSDNSEKLPKNETFSPCLISAHNSSSNKSLFQYNKLATGTDSSAHSD